MYIVKRGGRKEEVHLDKITSRIQKLCYGLNAEYIDPVPITLKVIQGLYPGITTTELDSLAAEIAATLTIQHPDYVILAARIAISNLHKETKKQFSEVVDLLYNSPTNKLTGERTPLISDEHYKIVMSNSERLNSCIIYDRDFSFDYFAFKVLEGSYLLRVNGKIVERPQHMLMRVAIGVHGDDIDSAIEMYNLMSEKYFIPSSTTLYAAATPKAKLCPSYSLMMPDDSIEGIFTCVAQCAYIAKGGAAVGVSIQNIRAKGSYIAGTNGVSNGLVPMLRVFNHTAQLVDEESNRRKGVISIYLEPWHADIFDVLSLKKGSGKEEVRARELSYCLWVPDLFMKRVEANGTWSLMCPQQCEDLINSWGKDFEILYEKYEAAGYYLRQIPAQELWKAIIVSQVETGMPHIMYKDTCNRKSNQKNVGTIKGGGYCTENVQIASENEAGTSSLASIAINMFVNQDRKSFDFDRLKQVTKSVTIALNKIIDINHYSIPEAKIGALRHRPLGIGVQGLADTFILMRMPFDSDEAANLNKQIFETIYYAALEASCELAEKFSTYETYDGSPLSQGVFQFDMCDVKPNLWDWESLKQKIAQYGVRNSLLISCMPTSTTSQIFSNNPSIEPLRSNIFTRRVTSGEFQVVNEHLLRDLTDRGIWDDAMKDSIISNNGSIQNIPNMPEDLKKIYKTVWEISQKVVINMAADRGAFIDQSQSLNIHIENLNYGTLSSMHFYGWKKGLKTGMYYLKTKSGMKSVELSKTAVSKVIKENGVNDHVSNGDKLESPDVEVDKNMSALVCSLQNPESCEMCGA